MNSPARSHHVTLFGHIVVSIVQMCLMTALLAVIASAQAQTPVDMGFTYQGRLTSGGTPANGPHNFEFTLWNAPSAGAMVGSAVTINAWPVQNGLFTVLLNQGDEFGPDPFNGDARWLQISVNGTPLLPRQELTAAPYAIRALEADMVTGIDGHSLDAADGSPVDALFVDANGNVGVGLLTPSTTLDANGVITSSGASGGTLRALNPANQGASVTLSWLNNVARIRVGGNGTGSTNGFDIQRGGDMSLLRILDNGSVGIGVTNPANKLTVNGSIRSLLNGFVFPDGTIQTTAATGAGGPWTTSGVDIYNNNAGNVGIGTISPGFKLHVESAGGRAIYGLATDTGSTTHGVYGQSGGPSGAGIYGDATGVSGIGVYGRATDTSSTNTTYGGWFEAFGDNGIGVFAESHANTGGSYGVYGSSSSDTGTGVYGQGHFGVRGSGMTGGRFDSSNESGTGVWGIAGAGSGVNYGVRGASTSPDGFAGYFEGRSYFSGNVGIGVSDPTHKLQVNTLGTSGVLVERVGDGYENTKASLNISNLNGPAGLRLRVSGDDGATYPDALFVAANTLNVGIGTTNPAQKLDVVGTVRSSSGGFMFPDGTTQLTAATGGGNSWSLAGNAGINPSTQFLGTVDNVALNLRVNDQRALRIEPNPVSPNIMGGHAANIISANVAGSVIGGGGQAGLANRVTDDFCTVSGGLNNVAGDNFGTGSDANLATVAGGQDNVAEGPSCTIGGGSSNYATDFASTVGGGNGNWAIDQTSTVGGGSGGIASGESSTVAGGEDNVAIGDFSTVAGGEVNSALAEGASVGGGQGNTASGNYGTVAGGLSNIANNLHAAVGGGQTNTASGGSSTIAGGASNTASGESSSIGGGFSNLATGIGARVSGGSQNQVTADFGTIGGGGWISGVAASGNRVTDQYGTVGGGNFNQAGDNAGTSSDAPFATVSGGMENSASAYSSTVAGGLANSASGGGSTVGGGILQTASGVYSCVGGGASNFAIGYSSTVSGGEFNEAVGPWSTVSGGTENTAEALRCTVGGGAGNTASGAASTVSGGFQNSAAGDVSTVGGGEGNTASGRWSAVAGGESNTASDDNGTVGGGSQNVASGLGSTVPGGAQNEAGGDLSFAAGFLAHVRNPIETGDEEGDEGTFVWADSIGGQFASTGPNQFLIRASGGVGIGTTAPASALHVNGMMRLNSTPANNLLFGGSFDNASIDLIKNTPPGVPPIPSARIQFNGFSDPFTHQASLQFFTKLSGDSGLTERMQIAADGRVGIGTANPQTGLHVDENSGILLERSVDYPGTQAGLQITSAAGPAGLRFALSADGGSSFVNPLFLTQTGNVGIGTFAPAQKLHVNGSVQASCGILTCSDARFKEQVEPLRGALDKVGQLRGVTFNWKRDEFAERQFVEGRQVGFIAQEAATVLPEVVQKGSDGYLSVDYGRLSPILVEALRELRAEKDQQLAEKGAEIAALRIENADLRGRLERLEALVAAIAAEPRK